MAGRGHAEINFIQRNAQALLGKHVREVRIIEDIEGRVQMLLYYRNRHRLLITKRFDEEVQKAGKLPFQCYHVKMIKPDNEELTSGDWLTAKMVKMAILKTKKIDLLRKGVNTWECS